MPHERWITKHYHSRGGGCGGCGEGVLAPPWGRVGHLVDKREISRPTPGLESFINSFFQRISEIDMQKFTVSEMIGPGVTFGPGQIQCRQLSAQFEMRYRIGSHQQFIARDARQ